MDSVGRTEPERPVSTFSIKPDDPSGPKLLTTQEIVELVNAALTPDTPRRVAQRRRILADAETAYGDWAPKFREISVQLAAARGHYWMPISVDIRMREALMGPMRRAAADEIVLMLRHFLQQDGY